MTPGTFSWVRFCLFLIFFFSFPFLTGIWLGCIIFSVLVLYHRVGICYQICVGPRNPDTWRKNGEADDFTGFKREG